MPKPKQFKTVPLAPLSLGYKFLQCTKHLFFLCCTFLILYFTKMASSSFHLLLLISTALLSSSWFTVNFRQRSCGCPIPGHVQGQDGWVFEQPGLVEGVPAHGRGVGTRWSIRSVPTQTILWFYDFSLICKLLLKVMSHHPSTEVFQ